MIQELIEKVDRLEAAVNQIIRQGIVTATYPDRGTARVMLPDADGMVTKELPVVSQRTSANQSYDMPDVDEHVICIFLPNGFELGFILGALYSTADPVPVSAQDKKHYRFKDESFFEYDRKAHALTINIKGRVDIHADGELTIDSGEHIKLTAPRIDLN